MIDDERRTRQPLSMTRRYRRGLILTGLLCALAVLTAATVLFQRSYAERIDNYLMQICHATPQPTRHRTPTALPRC